MAELWTPDSELLIPEQLTPKQQADLVVYAERMPEVAHRLVQHHVEAPDSIMVHYPEDPEDPMSRIGKDPMVFCVAGNRQPKKVVDGVAEIIAPGFMKARDKMLADRRASEIFDMIYGLIKEDQSVVVTTLHIRDLRDIAAAQIAADDFLLVKHQQKLGKSEAYEERIWQTSIPVNKAMAWAGVMFRGARVGVIPTVQILEDYILLTWPITESSEEERSKLPEFWLSLNNRSVRMANAILLGKAKPKGKWVPPQLEAIAFTGTTRISAEEDGKLRVSEIPDASIGLALGSYVVPMTAILNLPEPIIHPCSEPVLIERMEQVDELVQLMVDDHNRHAPGMDLYYKAPVRGRQQK